VIIFISSIPAWMSPCGGSGRTSPTCRLVVGIAA
jgi:hypothetical protein